MSAHRPGENTPQPPSSSRALSPARPGRTRSRQAPSRPGRWTRGDRSPARRPVPLRTARPPPPNGPGISRPARQHAGPWPGQRDRQRHPRRQAHPGRNRSRPPISPALVESAAAQCRARPFGRGRLRAGIGATRAAASARPSCTWPRRYQYQPQAAARRRQSSWRFPVHRATPARRAGCRDRPPADRARRRGWHCPAAPARLARRTQKVGGMGVACQRASSGPAGVPARTRGSSPASCSAARPRVPARAAPSCCPRAR